MRATAEEKKVRSLQTLRDERLALLEVAAAVPAEWTGTVFLGEWSARDIIAHLIGWDYANIEAVRAILNDRLPAFYAHHDHDWRSFNAELVRRYRIEDYDALLQAARESNRMLYDLLLTVRPESSSGTTACASGATRSPSPGCWRPRATTSKSTLNNCGSSIPKEPAFAEEIRFPRSVRPSIPGTDCRTRQPRLCYSAQHREVIA